MIPMMHDKMFKRVLSSKEARIITINELIDLDFYVGVRPVITILKTEV